MQNWVPRKLAQRRKNRKYEIITFRAAEKLEGQLQNAQRSIFGFKNECQSEFDQFIERENQLQREIDALNSRVELYERDDQQTMSRQRDGKVTKSSIFGHIDSRPVAVQRFQDFIAKRGQTDGWNSVDHNNFVRAWNRLADGTGDVWNEEELVSIVESDLPGRSEDNIITHIKFYR